MSLAAPADELAIAGPGGSLSLRVLRAPTAVARRAKARIYDFVSGHF